MIDKQMLKCLAVCASAVLALAAAGCADEASPSTAPVTAGETGGDFHSLVADPSVPGRLYVGGHTRVARSDDGGRSWTAVPALDSADAMGWAINQGAIWVSGHPGLTVSHDGGATFEGRSDALPDTDVHAFGAGDKAIYAAGPGIGVASSTDDGVSWKTLSTEAGHAFFGRILVDPNDSDHLIAADVQAGAMMSTDGGSTWTALGSEPAAWVSSGDSFTTLYASGGSTPQRSHDGGATWESVTVPAGATLLEAGSDGVVYAGVHDGNAVTVWISTDDGQGWTLP